MSDGVVLFPFSFPPELVIAFAKMTDKCNCDVISPCLLSVSASICSGTFGDSPSGLGSMAVGRLDVVRTCQTRLYGPGGESNSRQFDYFLMINVLSMYNACGFSLAPTWHLLRFCF